MQCWCGSHRYIHCDWQHLGADRERAGGGHPRSHHQDQTKKNENGPNSCEFTTLSSRIDAILSPNMQHQFIFIHDAILESVTCGDTQISATNLRTRIAKMNRNDSKNQPHGFQYQFKVCMIRVVITSNSYSQFFSCRFWSRFLLTLKRFTVVGHSTAQTETAVTNFYLVS